MDFTAHGFLTVWCLLMNKNYAQIERQELCDLFESVGPDHPTLCEGWSAADLAAHLVLRENSLKAIGLVAPGYLAKKLAKATKKLAQKKSFEELVEKVRSGPPFYLKRFDEAMNLFEFFVHHEDVRRGASGFISRTDIDDLENVLWAKQERFSKLLVRGLKGVDLTISNTAEETIYFGCGAQPVVLKGAPGEIALFLFGRRDHSEVELSGDPEAINEMKTGKLGG